MDTREEAPSNARAGMLVTLGVLCIVIAVFALVIHPGSTVEVPSLDLGGLGRVGGETREIVNLQKLAIGIASAIAGSVFFTGGVVAWRD